MVEPQPVRLRRGNTRYAATRLRVLPLQWLRIAAVLAEVAHDIREQDGPATPETAAA